MVEKKFLGARIEMQLIEIVDKVAKENKVDRTAAIKILINEGWNEIRLKKAIALYGDGIISIDKASKLANLTISEMMQEVAAHGIKSEETIEEYKKSLKNLLNTN